MKAAIVMPLAEARGGAEHMLMHLLRMNQVRPQVAYHLAFLEKGSMAQQAAELGYPVEIFPAGHIRQPHRALVTVLRLRRWFTGQGLDIAVSWMAKAHLYAGPAAYLARIPAVWWQHGVSAGHWLDGLAGRIPAHAVFCCSRAAQQAQQRCTPARPTRVIYPAVDTKRYRPTALPSPADARKQLGLPADCGLVGTVARLERGKGIHIFLEAAARLAADDARTQFVVVGGPHPQDPAYARELARHAAEHLPGRLHLAGQQADAALWLQALDTVVVPSIYPEGFGMVVVEAMSLGKVVIASRAGGPLETVDDGLDGFLVEPGDAEAMARMIARSLAKDERIVAMRAAARRKAASFGAERLAGSVAEALREIVSGTGRP